MAEVLRDAIALESRVQETVRKVHSDDWDNVKKPLDILVPAESALLGSAVGFYFGTKK